VHVRSGRCVHTWHISWAGEFGRRVRPTPWDDLTALPKVRALNAANRPRPAGYRGGRFFNARFATQARALTL
jgi:hypothetical protein